MRAWARWTLLVAVLALITPVALPARAEFGSCSDPAYLARFDERLRTIEYDCVERLRVSAAGAEIRVLHDLLADWIVSDSEMSEFDRGVRAAAEAMNRLGGVAMDNVTILLADDLPPRDPDTGAFSSVAAYAEMERDDECRVIVYLAGPGSLPEYAAFVIAHELFHCVQTANLTEAQMRTGSEGAGGGGDWWLEGSANWFAALALPDAGPLPEYVGDFDAQSSETALNRMAYGAVVFFLWLGAEESPPGVMTFLRQMASSRGDSAQHGAMASALGQDRWLDFATAYLDSDIRHPHGTDIGLSPREGETWRWADTRTQSVELGAFVLVRGRAAFECGRWRTSVRPDAYRAKADSEEWGDLPEEIDTQSAPDTYRIAAMSTERATLAIRGTMESGCGDCAGIVETDACVIGSWQLVGGGAVEWMRSQGVRGSFNMANENMTLRRDGSYITGAVSGQYHVRNPDGSRGDGDAVAQAGGRWSARDGTLNLCADMQRFGGTMTMTTPEGDRYTAPLPSMPPSTMSMSYTCSPTTLRTITPIPGGPPMPSEFARTSPPPREE